MFRSGPADSTPPSQLSKISKISVFLHKQTYHRLRGMPFLSTVRFQSNGFGFFPHSTLFQPHAPSSTIAIQRTSLHLTLHHAKAFIFSLSYSPDRNIRPLVPLGHHPTKHPLRNTLSIKQMPPNQNFHCAVQPAFCPHKTHSVMPTQTRQQ